MCRIITEIRPPRSITANSADGRAKNCKSVSSRTDNNRSLSGSYRCRAAVPSRVLHLSFPFFGCECVLHTPAIDIFPAHGSVSFLRSGGTLAGAFRTRRPLKFTTKASSPVLKLLSWNQSHSSSNSVRVRGVEVRVLLQGDLAKLNLGW